MQFPHRNAQTVLPVPACLRQKTEDTMNEKKKQTDLKLWLIIGAAALILIGIGAIVAVIAGNGITSVFESFTELSTVNIVLLIVAAVFIIGGIVALIIWANSKTPAESVGVIPAPAKKGWSIKQLIIGALCIGLAFVLSYIRIWKMPMGGSITPASMLPIMLFAYIYGTPKGLIVGVAYGLLQMIQDPWIVHPVQAICDYILAFAALALVGLFRKRLIAGEAVAIAGRFLFAFISGLVFFGEYGADWGMSPAVYSLVYQGTYLLPEAAICIIISAIPAVRKNIERIRANA